MYISNQARAKHYRLDRNSEERNSHKTQWQLYQKIAQDSGKDVQASQLGDLAMRVVSNVLKPQNDNTPSSFAKLISAINNNNLSGFMKKVEEVPASSLSEKAKIVQAVAKTVQFKEDANKHLEKLVKQDNAQPKRIISALTAEIRKNPMFQKLAQTLGSDDAEEKSDEVIEEGLSEITNKVEWDDSENHLLKEKFLTPEDKEKLTQKIESDKAGFDNTLWKTYGTNTWKFIIDYYKENKEDVYDTVLSEVKKLENEERKKTGKNKYFNKKNPEILINTGYKMLAKNLLVADERYSLNENMVRSAK